MCTLLLLPGAWALFALWALASWWREIWRQGSV